MRGERGHERRGGMGAQQAHLSVSPAQEIISSMSASRLWHAWSFPPSLPPSLPLPVCLPLSPSLEICTRLEAALATPRHPCCTQPRPLPMKHTWRHSLSLSSLTRTHSLFPPLSRLSLLQRSLKPAPSPADAVALPGNTPPGSAPAGTGPIIPGKPAGYTVCECMGVWVRALHTSLSSRPTFPLPLALLSSLQSCRRKRRACRVEFVGSSPYGG